MELIPSRVLNRIAKLERLAAAPGTPEEGKAASAKATELRKKYGLFPLPIMLAPDFTSQVNFGSITVTFDNFTYGTGSATQTLKDFGY